MSRCEPSWIDPKISAATTQYVSRSLDSSTLARPGPVAMQWYSVVLGPSNLNSIYCSSRGPVNDHTSHYMIPNASGYFANGVVCYF